MAGVKTMKRRMLGLVMVLTALALDQISKAIVVANALALENGIAVFPGFNLVFLRNDGVAFGLLGGLPWWALTTLAVGVIAFLAVELWRSAHAGETLAFGMVIGGALGNVGDRIRFGAVTDFLDFYIGTTHWPSFNLADIAVVCGASLLILYAFAKPRRPKEA